MSEIPDSRYDVPGGPKRAGANDGKGMRRRAGYAFEQMLKTVQGLPAGQVATAPLRAAPSAAAAFNAMGKSTGRAAGDIPTPRGIYGGHVADQAELIKGRRADRNAIHDIRRIALGNGDAQLAATATAELAKYRRPAMSRRAMIKGNYGNSPDHQMLAEMGLGRSGSEVAGRMTATHIAGRTNPKEEKK